jgi:hypothetical protein
MVNYRGFRFSKCSLQQYKGHVDSNLSYKYLAVANALAFFNAVLITTVKIFVVMTPYSSQTLLQC